VLITVRSLTLHAEPVADRCNELKTRPHSGSSAAVVRAYGLFGLLGLLTAGGHVGGVLFFLEVLFLSVVTELQGGVGRGRLLLILTLVVLGAVGRFSVVVGRATGGGSSNCRGFTS